jgi:hypothetical protein
MRGRNIRDSVGFITLGLFSHTLLDELREIERNPSSGSKKNLQLAIESIKALRGEIPLDRTTNRRDLLFQDYQEASTLQEILNTTPLPIEDLESLLQKINTGTELETLKANVEQAVAFFKKLAQRAILNIEFEDEQVPLGVYQLGVSTA